MDKLAAMEAFVAVVRHGGFTAAGRALGLPPSSVTRRIQGLEEALGARLLHRTTRAVHLTEEGAVYHERCVHVLDEVARADQTVGTLRDTPRGTLRVASPPGFTESGLKRVVVAYLERYPEVSIEIVTTRALSDFHAERLDVAIVLGEPRDDVALVSSPLFHGEGLLVASPSYLDARGRPARVEDLADHDLVTVPFALGDASFVTRRVRVCAESDVLRRYAALAGLGIAPLPPFLVNEDLAAGRLEAVLEDEVSLRGTLWVVHAKLAALPGRTRAFLEVLHEAFGDA